MTKGKLFFILNLLSLVSWPSYLHAVVISIHNNLSVNDEGSLLEVEKITSKEGYRGKFKLKIYPGETKEISGTDVIGFQVSRIFSSHKLRYEISCEESSSHKEATFNIAQIHEGKLSEGCKLTGYGHWSRRSGLNWIMKKKSALDSYKGVR